ncbi:hypothetical protein AcW1_004056 [Taiwanofungus camphoratus]|nr:hypothetical protein AcW2_006939 [Antrodia cinnamomea]KAI0951769.1 hypothetical protein AcV7_007773 [Antrodia cinnamomea]KAI0959139.1 hypothetical protein AcW1_004056 [Antrodia cinnamomea]
MSWPYFWILKATCPAKRTMPKIADAAETPSMAMIVCYGTTSSSFWAALIGLGLVFASITVLKCGGENKSIGLAATGTAMRVPFRQLPCMDGAWMLLLRSWSLSICYRSYINPGTLETEFCKLFRYTSGRHPSTASPERYSTIH